MCLGQDWVENWTDLISEMDRDHISGNVWQTVAMVPHTAHLACTNQSIGHMDINIAIQQVYDKICIKVQMQYATNYIK